MTAERKSCYTIMVVDDDPSVRATYRRLLSREGYSTRIEDDPKRVLDEHLVENGVDLLLLDQKMPGMDGLTFLSRLRGRDCRVRCILISASLDEDLRIQARDLGVDRILEKPVDAGYLRQMIHELLSFKG